MSKHVVMIAGEESGDQHAAKLIKQLQMQEPSLRFSGMGGKHLQALGMTNVFDLTQCSITGLSGVFTHLRLIRQAFKTIKAHLLASSPDLVILVDYPGFNLRMAKWIKTHLKCPVLYYISPQLWAWKPKRIELIRQYVDHMAVILPFEYELYQKNNIPVSYVGHPLLESLSLVPSKMTCRQALGLDENAKLLAICPGSRRMEISRLLPVIIEALKKLPKLDIQLVVPVAKSLSIEEVAAYFKDCPFPYKLVGGQAQNVMQAADAVIVASGTASLESAILQKPSCIIYKSSWLNHYLALKVLLVKYFGLSNLLQNQMVIPELLQSDCNSTELAKMTERLLTDEVFRSQMTTKLQELKQLLTPQDVNILPKLVCDFLIRH